MKELSIARRTRSKRAPSKWSGGDPLANGIHPIGNRDDHRAALKVADYLVGPKARSRENSYLEAIGVLIGHYELKRLNRFRNVPLVRPYNETVWKRFWRDPEFAQALALEVKALSRNRPRRSK